MRLRAVVLSWVVLLGVGRVVAETAPGVRLELVGTAAGFVSSIAVDSKGTLYYTTTKGGIFRLAGGQSIPVATVTTEFVGNAGLLGMALLDDRTAVVHYTTLRQTYDVISRIDLQTGAETVVHSFPCDIEFPERGSNPEHHGGNPTVAKDGSIFVGIGDFGGGLIASLPQWNGGKIFRIFPDGTVVQWARGLRNPFDLVFDDERQRVVVTDNGPVGGDELHDLPQGANCGWPFTFGNEPPVEGGTVPIYVWGETIAPTGMTRLNQANPVLRGGYLVGSFVTKAIYYFADLTEPVGDPLTLIEREVGPVLDVVQAPNGEVYFANAGAIYHLILPARGDCNGDGFTNTADLAALQLEISDGAEPHRALSAPQGTYPGSWGCDADGDGMIDTTDLVALARLVHAKARAIRGR